MSKQKTSQPPFTVSVLGEPNTRGALRFTFTPKDVHFPSNGGHPKTEYILSVNTNDEELSFNWAVPPRKETLRAEFEEMAGKRFIERNAWIERVSGLVTLIEGWAKESDWVTKRIEKKIEDNSLGNHKVAGLVMQQDTVRILLEPISASAPGSDGLVDLCLMPGYDDIASLYHQENGWQVLYVFPAKTKIEVIKEGETRPLTKKTLGVILDAMKKHAE